jgi:hypothetical protein
MKLIMATIKGLYINLLNCIETILPEVLIQNFRIPL